MAFRPIEMDIHDSFYPKKSKQKAVRKRPCIIANGKCMACGIHERDVPYCVKPSSITIITPMGYIRVVKNRNNAVCKDRKKRFVVKIEVFECFYCGYLFDIKMLTIDHVIPKSKEGEDTEDNTVAACFDCNHGKGDLLPEEYIESDAFLRVPLKRRELVKGKLRKYFSSPIIP